MAKRAKATDHTSRRIEAALTRLLGSRPYNDITVVEIAAEADVAVRTVQRHFRTKDDVLAACIRFPQEVAGEAWGAEGRPRSAADDLRWLVERMFALYNEHTAEAWATFTRSQDVPVLEAAWNTAIATRAARIDELLARWPNAWDIDGATARRLVLALTSFPVWLGFTDRDRFTSREAAQEVIRILSERLLGPGAS